MSNLTTVQSLKGLMNHPATQEKFEKMLGDRTQGFFVSVSNAVSSNSQLLKADPQSILMAAAVAAALDLPVDNNLGFAYIVPYNVKVKGENGRDTWKVVAQFQMGYKGFNQLALRTGQYETINVVDVREGEIGREDFLTGEITFNWLPRVERLEKKIVGYVSYFRLITGFWKMLYMSNEELTAHASRYSQTFKKDGKGKWKDDFDSMAKKTVNKLLLSKWGPLSIDLKTAIAADQAVIKGYDNGVVDTDYIDNTPPSIEEQAEQKQIDRLIAHIENAQTHEELEKVYEFVFDAGLTDMYTVKKDELDAKLKAAK